MSKWKTETLKSLTLQITDGKHGDCQNENNSGYYFISCKDIFDEKIHYTDARQITYADYLDTHKRTRLEINDILITNSGTIGRMAFISDAELCKKTTFQKSVAIVKPDPQKIYPKYLYYLLQSLVGSFVNSSNGSAQKNLLLSTMRDFSVCYINDVPVQRKIADVLSAYDDLIENNRKQIKLLEEAARRLYKEWFIDLRFPGYENTKIINGIPEGWEKILLRNLIEIKYGKDHKNIPDGNIPVYGSGGFMRKCLRALHNGEAVLIPRKGSLNNIMYVNENFWTVDTMFYALMKRSDIGFFIYFLLKSFDMYAMNIGAAVPSMTTSTLNAIDVVLPTATILEDFHNNVNALFKRISILNKQNYKLMESRDRLLKKLL